MESEPGGEIFAGVKGGGDGGGEAGEAGEHGGGVEDGAVNGGCGRVMASCSETLYPKALGLMRGDEFSFSTST